MLYRVVFKKYSDLAKGFQLVEEDIDAAHFDTQDGNLLFYNADGTPIAAMPMGSWASVEPATVSNTPTLIVGGA